MSICTFRLVRVPLTVSSHLWRCHRACHRQSEIYHSALASHDNYDRDYYENEANFAEIIGNIRLRNMEQFRDLPLDDKSRWRELISKHLSQLPNKVDPIWLERRNVDEPVTVATVGERRTLDFEPRFAEDLLQQMGLLYLSEKRKGNLGLVGGNRSYAFVEDAARLEQALIRWTTNQLVERHQFTPVTVPQMVYDEVVDACGFNPYGKRTQIYGIAADPRVCLTGTAEIPLAAMHIGETFEEEDLPKRYCATSRCYRAEADTTAERAGLYRVHYFNKVEMFAVSSEEQSAAILSDMVAIERELYEQLGLHFRVLDMPPHELGRPATRKFDVEAYMYGRKIWGELSSASNCTDFQSRRLNIRYRRLALNEETNEVFEHRFAHTINATACAVPRLLIAVCEQYQTAGGRAIVVPDVLRQYMNGQEVIERDGPAFFKRGQTHTGELYLL